MNKHLYSKIVNGFLFAFVVFFLNLTKLNAQTTLSTPTGLTADVQLSYVTVSWDANPSDQGVTGYLTGTYISSVGNISNPASGTSCTYTYNTLGLLPGAQFYVAVRAVGPNSSLSGWNSIRVTVPTPPPPTDTQSPDVPSISNSTPTVNNVGISWNTPYDNVGVVGYDVFTYTSSPGYPISTTSNSSTINYSDLGLTAGQSFKVSVRARDAAGNVSGYSNELIIVIPDVQAPTAPTLTTAQLSLTNALMSWSGSTDNVAVVGYDFFIYSSSPGNPINVTGNSFDILFSSLNLPTGSIFKVKVRAKDAAGNVSGFSNEIALTVPTPTDVQPPTAPVLTSAAPTLTNVLISWSGSTDNVGVAGYNIHTYFGAPGNLTYSTTGTSFTIEFFSGALGLGLSPGTTFKVSVRARDAAGNLSAFSNELQITVPVPITTDTQAPTVPTNLSVSSQTTQVLKLQWSPSTDNVGVAKYVVYVGPTLDFGPPLPPVEFTTTTNSISLVAYTTSVKIYVKAFDAAGNMSAISAILIVPPLAFPDIQAPTAPVLSNAAPGLISVVISWSGSTDNMAVTGYDLFTYQNAIGNPLASIAGTNYTINYSALGLNEGDSFKVVVRAKDAAGNVSLLSNIIKIKIPKKYTLTKPTNLTATNLTSAGFQLNWESTNDNTVTYQINRTITAILTMEVYTSTTNKSIYIQNIGTARFYYKVRAVKLNGQDSSDWSENILVIPPTGTVKINKVNCPSFVRENQNFVLGSQVASPNQNSLSYKWYINGINLFNYANPSVTISLPGVVNCKLVVTDNVLGKSDSMNFSFTIYRALKNLQFTARTNCRTNGVVNNRAVISVLHQALTNTLYPYDLERNYAVYTSSGQYVCGFTTNIGSLYNTNGYISDGQDISLVQGDIYTLKIKRKFADTTIEDVSMTDFAIDGKPTYTKTITAPLVYGNNGNLTVYASANNLYKYAVGNIGSIFNTEPSLPSYSFSLPSGNHTLAINNYQNGCSTIEPITIATPPIVAITELPTLANEIMPTMIPLHYNLTKLNPSLNYSYQILLNNSPVGDYSPILQSSTGNGTALINPVVNNLVPNTGYFLSIRIRITNNPNAVKVESKSQYIVTSSFNIITSNSGGNLRVTLPYNLPMGSIVTLKDQMNNQIGTYTYNGNLNFSWQVGNATMSTYFLTIFTPNGIISQKVPIIR
jgi:chitodextrinase